jgi:hypothetical protein
MSRGTGDTAREARMRITSHPHSARGFASSMYVCIVTKGHGCVSGLDREPTLSAICVVIIVLAQSCLKSINSSTCHEMAHGFLRMNMTLLVVFSFMDAVTC